MQFPSSPSTESLQSPSRRRFPTLKSSTSKPWLLSPDPSESTEPPSPSSASIDEGGYFTDDTSPPASDAGLDECKSHDVASWRNQEYPQLKDQVYLDTGGSMLYAQSLITRFAADLTQNLYGNPHSSSTPSARAGHRVDAIRHKALRFFNADPDEWDLVFTANASAAIKLAVECIRDHAALTATPIWYGYHKDAHTSLVGVRELVSTHRCFVSDDEVDKWISSGGFGGARSRELGLFAYPGQSNFSGRRLPLSWCRRVRSDVHKARTYTLLDAAALVSTASLDLSDIAAAPDFVALSFYKIFGFPNIGALLVRKDSQHVLEGRRFFGGGTVDMVIAINDTWHVKKQTSIHGRLEDGTLPFHSIFALDHAIDVHKELYGPDPMKFISTHTAELARQLFSGLTSLKHANGAPVVTIYSDPGTVYGDSSVQGATIAFNILKATGAPVGYEEVEKAADAEGIYVRSGSLCNPGGVATYLNWTPADMRAAYDAGHRCSQPIQNVIGKPTGVVRASIGAMNTAADINALVGFLARTYVDSDATVVLPTQSTPSRVSQDVEVKSRAQPLISTPSEKTLAARHAPTDHVLQQHSKRRFGRSVSALLGKRSAQISVS